MSADPYAIPQAHRPIPDRLTYVPSWYDPSAHSDLSIQVRDESNGMLGFTIGQVLPERRWAIGRDGKLLPRAQFEDRYRDWISRVATKGGQIISIAASNKFFDVELETVPPADEFVDAKVDPQKPGENRYVPINYDGTAAGNGRVKIRPIYNAMGEKVIADAPQPSPADGFEPAAPEAKASESMVVTPCGKEVRANRLNQHKSICKQCKLAAEGRYTPPQKSEEQPSA